MIFGQTHYSTTWFLIWMMRKGKEKKMATMMKRKKDWKILMKKGIGMKCKFALESYTGHHFDKTSDVLSIVGLETFKNGVVGDIVACMLSHFSSFQLFATHRAPLSIGFSKQEYWSGLPCLSPGDLPDPGVEPGSPALQADSLPFEPRGKTLVFIFISIFSLFQIYF